MRWMILTQIHMVSIVGPVHQPTVWHYLHLAQGRDRQELTLHSELKKELQLAIELEVWDTELDPLE